MHNTKKQFQIYDEDRPRFVIMGVGGAGCNTIYRMYKETVEKYNEDIFGDKYEDSRDLKNNKKGVKIFGLNTDQQSLKYISSDTNIQTIQLGLDGLGAGSNPDTGRLAAEYSAQEIQEAIENADIVVIVAGFGGGTGTGAAPFIAELAKKMGKLVIGFITKPFFFEGLKKLNTAQEGLKLFVNKADTTIVLSNQLLFSVTNASTHLNEAYLMIDKVSIELVMSLISMLKGIAMMNVDFADFKKATQNPEEGGLGIVGFGEATGVDAAKRAVEMALSVPLFEPINSGESAGMELHGANHILIHIVSEGSPITLSSLENIVTSLTKGINKDASVKVGVNIEEKKHINGSFLNINETEEQKIKIVFIATGFQNKQVKDTSNMLNNKYKYMEENLNNEIKNLNSEIKNELNLEENNSFLKTQNINNEPVKEEQKLFEEKEKANKKKKAFSESFFEAFKSRFNLNN